MLYSTGGKKKNLHASVIEIDDIVDDKLPTFTDEEVDSLFFSKCKDLTILPFPI